MPERLDLPDDELARLYQDGLSAYALGLRSLGEALTDAVEQCRPGTFPMPPSEEI